VTGAPPPPSGPLVGLRVVDLATVLAAPSTARYLADFGADVVKVERPSGDTWRNVGWKHDDGSSLWWKFTNRNKRTVALDLTVDADRDVLLRLLDDAHVLIENMRVGTLEKLGLAPEVLHARNPRLVILRVTGFGQDGPYRRWPGFATTAEAMGGFAAVNGHADGPPLLPPIALTDEIAGIVGAFAVMAGVHAGVGQVIDVNLLESIFQVMGPTIGAYAREGYVQTRAGSAIPYTVPRGTYRCADGAWVAVSTSADTVANRVLALLGVAGDERFTTFAARVRNREALEALLAAWIAQRARADVVAAFEAADAAVSPVYDIADFVADPHVRHRGLVAEVDGIAQQGLVARFSRTPGALRWSGRAIDADGAEIRSRGWG
jgi:crotonobetainyl-CoA:carnitine CoA-transferase CaiB-like acyl-CoA transferase